MRYRLLGRSGLRVSEVCLGTLTFGGGAPYVAGADAAESRAIFDVFVDAGGTFIDTSCSYGCGASEALLGEFIAADRDALVIATKYTNTIGGGLAKSGNSRRNMMRSVEESLRRLKTERIDLFQLHHWDLMTPIDEVVRGFDDLVASGKVLYVGVSNTPAWEIARANTMADLLGMTPLISIQVMLSLVQRDAENDLLPMARALDLGVLAWGPLAAGVLARAPGETGRAFQPLTERDHRLVAELEQIARELGASQAQVALAALRQLPGYERVIPIVGADHPQQMADSLGFLDLTLTDEQMARVREVSVANLVYPTAMLSSPAGEELTTGGQPGLVDNHRQWPPQLSASRRAPGARP